MPIFEYTCPTGHKHDHIHRWSEGERPATRPCTAEGCAEVALYGFAPPAPTMGCKPEARERVEKPDHGLAMHDYKCTNPECAVVFEELTDFDAGEHPRNGRPCPACKQQAVYKPGANVAAWSVKQFGASGGYFDRGLGMWISSPQQRKDEAEKRGLIIYDDESDNFLDQKFREHDDQVAKEERELADYYDKLDHAPGFAPLRRAMDQGVL